MWTKVRTASGDAGFDDFGAATGALEAVAAKNLSEFFEIIAATAVSFNVSGHGGTAGSDGFFHDRAGGKKKALGFGFRDGTGFAGGMDAGGKKRLVGVNITEAADDGLI